MILTIPSEWNHMMPYSFKLPLLVTIILPAFQSSTKLHFTAQMFVDSFSFDNMSTVDWLTNSNHPFGIATNLE